MLSSSLGGSCGCRALFLYHWFSGDFREAAVTSAELPEEFVKWFLFVAGSANPWTLLKVDLHLLCGNDAKWNHCSKWFHSPGLSLYLREWDGMLTRFLFIRFNLYLPSGAHFCLFSSLSTFSRRWADKGYLGAGEIPCVQTQKSPCCHPERCLTCSFFRTRCVCLSHPQCLSTTKWKQTQKRWDSSHPWVLLLLICGSSIQTLHSSSSSKALFSARIDGELLVRRSLLVSKWWSQQRCSLWHSCIPPACSSPGLGKIYLSPGNPAAGRPQGVLSLFSPCSAWGWCLFLLAVTGLSSPPWGRTTLLAQVALPMMRVWTEHGTHFDILLVLLRKHFPF